MKEFLYHALGVCGEHSHPHLLHVTAIVAIAIVVSSIIVYRRVKQ
jgi:hypothetical protein